MVERARDAGIAEDAKKRGGIPSIFGKADAQTGPDKAAGRGWERWRRDEDGSDWKRF